MLIYFFKNLISWTIVKKYQFNTWLTIRWYNPEITLGCHQNRLKTFFFFGGLTAPPIPPADYLIDLLGTIFFSSQLRPWLFVRECRDTLMGFFYIAPILWFFLVDRFYRCCDSYNFPLLRMYSNIFPALNKLNILIF